MNKFPQSVGLIGGILEINNVLYVNGSIGISTLNNKFYKYPSNKQYGWGATCRVGKNIFVALKEIGYHYDDVQSRLFNAINCKWSHVFIRTKRSNFAVVYYLNKIFIIGGWDGWKALN